MDVEIRTLSGEVWLTSVERDVLPEVAPGAAVAHVRKAIQAGHPVRVHRPPDRESRAFARTPGLLMVFNPGTVVSVAEEDARRRP